jgi:hypothetical protein
MYGCRFPLIKEVEESPEVVVLGALTVVETDVLAV